MKQDLSLHIKQKMVMTPKMQQSVKILQMSSQELHETIEQEYNENPTLEFDESTGNTDQLSDEKIAADDINNLAEFLNDRSSNTHSVSHDGYDFKQLPAPGSSLADMLHEQAGFTFTNYTEQHIADYIIGCIDGRGYLTISTKEIALSTNTAESFVIDVLQRIQSFDPIGVGARDLSECLRLQARYSGIYHGLIAVIIDKHLHDLAKNQIKKIAQQENTSINAVQTAVDKIKHLDPKPGSSYSDEQPKLIIPDVTVRKIDNDYIVFVNEYTVPSLRISDLYRNTHDMDVPTKKYVEQRVNSAIWLINSIEQRRRTLYNVSAKIIFYQKDFFDKGNAFLHPLSMKLIADKLDIHESTVSRAIANKYMETPHGIISIRSFFNTGITANAAGEELIAGQIKNIIRGFIDKENNRNPLSDQKICDLLKQQDINISRRTVMKYREQLGYPSSTNRKQYK
ncbi:RNA polymerase factor sigma-54 [Pectinatus sottacetonis]|uniref:RNA polymerase factor sigma-54 n=1 Tax=Pectinatus sottacetonis TaxID=1002795 RepID=UPI0018C65D58|nr:RNA polymerase factor sigma-54 [Pectinatus sottacetonis]